MSVPFFVGGGLGGENGGLRSESRTAVLSAFLIILFAADGEILAILVTNDSLILMRNFFGERAGEGVFRFSSCTGFEPCVVLALGVAQGSLAWSSSGPEVGWMVGEEPGDRVWIADPTASSFFLIPSISASALLSLPFVSLTRVAGGLGEWSGVAKLACIWITSASSRWMWRMAQFV